MPNREDIVTEFRDAAATVLIPSDREHFLQMAAQVEAMRCYTCNYQSSYVNEWIWCTRWNTIFPPLHGCFEWMEKDE